MAAHEAHLTAAEAFHAVFLQQYGALSPAQQQAAWTQQIEMLKNSLTWLAPSSGLSMNLNQPSSFVDYQTFPTSLAQSFTTSVSGMQLCDSAPLAMQMPLVSTLQMQTPDSTSLDVPPFDWIYNSCPAQQQIDTIPCNESLFSSDICMLRTDLLWSVERENRAYPPSPAESVDHEWFMVPRAEDLLFPTAEKQIKNEGLSPVHSEFLAHDTAIQPWPHRDLADNHDDSLDNVSTTAVDSWKSDSSVEDQSHSYHFDQEEQSPPPAPKRKPANCEVCNVTLCGKHEMQRHMKSQHPEKRRKVWVVAPETAADKKILGKCKSCESQHEYVEKYNCAAHLRRMHFAVEHRRQKGRKGGAPAGEYPPMEELCRLMKRVVAEK